MAADDRIRWSSEQWSETCEAADSSEEDKTEYEFSNGRKFKRE